MSVIKKVTENPQITITGVPDNWSKGPVTLSVICSAESGSVFCEYTTGDGTWTEFTPGELTFSNRFVTFRATDSNGNITTESVDLKIDRLKPEIEIPGGYAATWSNQNIVITPNITDDASGVAEKFVRQGLYGTWQKFDNSVTISEYGTYYFKATDNAGNATGEDDTYVTVKVDKIAPTVTVDAPAHWVHGSATISAVFADEGGSGISTQEYSTDGETWLAYTKAITFTESATYYFRTTDVAGNITETEGHSIEFDNIPPTISVSGAPEGWTSEETVTLNAVFADEGGSGLKNAEYSTDGTNWTPYTTSLTFDETTTVIFRATDNAGNITTETKEVKIDTSTPEITVSGLSEKWVCGTITVSAEFTNAGESDIISKQYCLSDGIWRNYTGELKFNNPQTITFRCTNGAKTTFTTEVFEVKADAFAPVITVTGDPNLYCNTPVTLDIDVTDKNGSGVATAQYSYDKILWINCPSTLTIDSHKTIYFRATDVAGNQSEKSVEILVDRIAPEIKIAKNIDDTEWQNRSVTLSATFTDAGDSGLVKTEFSADDGATWQPYQSPITASTYTKLLFRATDNAGNAKVIQSEIRSDTIAPEISVTGAPAAWTRESITLHADFTDQGGSGIQVQRYSVNGVTWQDYTDDLNIAENCTVRFLCTDNAKNAVQKEVVIDKIDTVAPTIAWQNVPTSWVTTPRAVSAEIADNCSGVKTKEYSFDGTTYYEFGSSVYLDHAENLILRATDNAGNITTEQRFIAVDCQAPSVQIAETQSGKSVTLNLTFSDADSGVSARQYTPVGSSTPIELTENEASVVVNRNGTLRIQAQDVAGNEMSKYYTVNSIFDTPTAALQGLYWQKTRDGEKDGYFVYFSKDNFATCIKIALKSSSLDIHPGEYTAFRIYDSAGTAIHEGELTATSTDTPQVIRAESDGKADYMTVRISGTWGRQYSVKHVGSVNGGQATNEKVSLQNHGRITDIYQGGTDACTLFLTDNDNGDALLADDLYSSSAENAGKTVSRFSGISEIFCGAGADIVDVTGVHFADNSGNMKIHGGDGNDILWATGENNVLFGDAGNDRIVGGGGSDFICGGSGENSLHGGGGNDFFCLGDNGNTDTIEQFDDGNITIWFDREYDCTFKQTDDDLHIFYGNDCEIIVKNRTEADISVLFGDIPCATSTYTFAELKDMGAFDTYSSQTICVDTAII